MMLIIPKPHDDPQRKGLVIHPPFASARVRERHTTAPLQRTSNALPLRRAGSFHHPLKGVPMKIEGSIALVTGASSGIGEATALRLAAAGYKVYGTSRREVQAGRRQFQIVPLDVTSDESVEAAVKGVLSLNGRIDLLLNNAGFGVAPGGAQESSIEQAKAIFDSNFFGLVRMTRAVVPHMRRQARWVSRDSRGREQDDQRGDGNCRTAGRRRQRRAGSGHHRPPKTTVYARWAREPSAIASQICPGGLVDAGIRKDLRLDLPTASLPHTPVLEK